MGVVWYQLKMGEIRNKKNCWVKTRNGRRKRACIEGDFTSTRCIYRSSGAHIVLHIIVVYRHILFGRANGFGRQKHCTWFCNRGYISLLSVDFCVSIHTTPLKCFINLISFGTKGRGTFCNASTGSKCHKDIYG